MTRVELIACLAALPEERRERVRAAARQTTLRWVTLQPDCASVQAAAVAAAELAVIVEGGLSLLRGRADV